jgi:hypothetical protein
MKAVFFLLIVLQAVLPALFLAQQQQTTDQTNPPDIVILRHSWGEFRRPVPQDPRIDEYPAINKSQRQVFNEEVSNHNSIENRSRDLLIMEQRARMGDQEEPKQYRYAAEFKNNGTKTIKALFWDYQTGDQKQASSVTHREFACGTKIKPNETKQLEGFTIGPAVRVVSAENKRPDEQIIINRIEFTDGSTWQRSDWAVPDEVLKFASSGRCRFF